MRLFVLTLFAVGVVIALGGAAVVMKNHMTNRAEFAALEDHGQRANASIVSRERVTGRNVSLSGRYRRSTGYFVTSKYDSNAGSRGTISFNTALEGGEQDFNLDFEYLLFRLPVSKAQYDAAESGSQAEVIFLPDAPETVRLIQDDGTFGRPSGIPWAIGLVILSVISAMMFHQYRTTGRTM